MRPSTVFLRGGQASLEMAVALVGMMLLLFGSLQVFVWINGRVIQRQMDYEATRVTAGSTTPSQASEIWTDAQRQTRLDLFPND